jgi:PAS domain S-box-containing protein
MAAKGKRALAGRRTVAELEAELEKRTAELQELAAERDAGLARENAVAEVLQVINSSPGDLAPVFDAILGKAMRLCEASFGVMALYDGEYLRATAMCGVPPALVEFMSQPQQPTPSNAFYRLMEGEDVVQIDDVTDSDTYRSGNPLRRALVNLGGARTALWVALRNDEKLLGDFVLYRQEVRPFTDKQIALLQNFAAQAVIAMENARLITETREALEQQTATAEVLGVINSSPGNLRPVFDAILDKAHALCGVMIGTLYLYDGELFKAAAARGYPEELAVEFRRGMSGAVPILAPLVAGERMTHIADVSQVDSPLARAASELGGVRTALALPLRREGVLLGAITCSRTEVRLFSDKEIALLENFAAQAVIAMENARLITETRGALEQQTATAEVLGVINSSPGDLTPVWDAMLDKAMRLCGAALGALYTYDGETFTGMTYRGVSPELTQSLREPARPHPGGLLARLVEGNAFAQVEDLSKTEAYRAGNSVARQMVDALGARTVLVVALRKDRTLLGYLGFHRQEVRPFTDKQITLLQNFAAQAVIAMENARLLTETREALEQQTATAEVLGVINSSPGDLRPVFEAMVERAVRLCAADEALVRTFDGERLRLAAVHGAPGEAETLRQLGPATLSGMYEFLARDQSVSHVADVRETAAYQMPLGRARLDARHVRSWLGVALRKDGALLGVINVHRREVRPFSEKQIGLLQNFAAQAVIAIENARLITETQEALEQQTATAEVLGVINSSPGDLAPVFDAMLEKAVRLCEADTGHLFRFENDAFFRLASRGVAEDFDELFPRETPVPLNPNSGPARMIANRSVVHVRDVREDESYWLHRCRDEVAAVEAGILTVLFVPLIKEGEVVGHFTMHRMQVKPFSEKQIALVQNFAAQAVIAMDNARLLEEIRQRQAELRVTFDNMADGVVMFDEELRLAAWNKNFRELLDLPDELLEQRKTYAEYLHILAERGEFGLGDVEEELRRRLAHPDEELRFERIRPDGTVLEVRRNAVAGGGFVLIYSDITERKRSEEEIRAARDAAEAALRDLQTAQSRLIQAEKMASLGQLTAGIAHEIKNPLNFVNNFASLSNELLGELRELAEPAFAALEEGKREEADETIAMLSGNLDKIVEHGKRADNIIKSMLAHSRGSSGDRQVVDLNALVDASLNLAYHGARAQDQAFNITLERDFDRTLKPIELVPQDMTRVFLNLFGNGFYAANKRAHANGDAAFHPVLCVATRDDGDAVEVRVRDNGTGIPPDIRDKLFQPFFTTKPTGEGTGLGLSISYDIITQQHGGTIAVESEVGAYTEFTIRLPRAGAEKANGRAA